MTKIQTQQVFVLRLTDQLNDITYQYKIYLFNAIKYKLYQGNKGYSYIFLVSNFSWIANQ